MSMSICIKHFAFCRCGFTLATGTVLYCTVPTRGRVKGSESQRVGVREQGAGALHRIASHRIALHCQKGNRMRPPTTVPIIVGTQLV